jgi:hypothetical protein
VEAAHPAPPPVAPAIRGLDLLEGLPHQGRGPLHLVEPVAQVSVDGAGPLDFFGQPEALLQRVGRLLVGPAVPGRQAGDFVKPGPPSGPGRPFGLLPGPLRW